MSQESSGLIDPPDWVKTATNYFHKPLTDIYATVMRWHPEQRPGILYRYTETNGYDWVNELFLFDSSELRDTVLEDLLANFCDDRKREEILAMLSVKQVL